MKHRKATSAREVRTYTSALPLTIRTTADGSKQVAGYAVIFNSQSLDLGGFTEIVAPTALDRTLRENPDVLALRDHKQELLLGRTTANTLELRTDDKGLAFTLTLPKTQIGDDTAENVRLRNLTGCSFGFSCVDDSWAADENGNVMRTLLDVDLWEISLTSFPAYQDTSVATRSRAAEMRSKLSTRGVDDTQLGDDSDPDDVDDDDDGCECICSACQTDDCMRCTNRDCRDENCSASACPAQDDARVDTLRVRQLFAHRMAR